MRPPRLRCTLFPLIYPPHLLVLPATFGLHLLLQTYPYFRALYVISVRRTKSLLTASFRFHLTMNTLAVRLYTFSLPRRVRDFHPLERAHGAQTKGSTTCKQRAEPMKSINTQTVFNYSMIVAIQQLLSKLPLWLFHHFAFSYSPYQFFFSFSLRLFFLRSSTIFTNHSTMEGS